MTETGADAPTTATSSVVGPRRDIDDISPATLASKASSEQVVTSHSQEEDEQHVLQEAGIGQSSNLAAAEDAELKASANRNTPVVAVTSSSDGRSEIQPATTTATARLEHDRADDDDDHDDARHSHATEQDVEKQEQAMQSQTHATAAAAAEAPDVEHVAVEDDPRKWTGWKKNQTFLFVCVASLTAGMAANIFLPAIDSLKRDLGASQQIISLSVSLFILLQGIIPIFWSGVSEIYGRKIVYIFSFAIFTVTQIVCAVSKSPGLFLAMRVLSTFGASAVLTLGGGTLADIYDSHERGTRVGIYYMFPLLGPSIGTLLGGALSSTNLQWRATFWFMTAYGALVFLWACFFNDTFRKERSLAWRAAYARAKLDAKARDDARKEAAFQAARRGSSPSSLSSPRGGAGASAKKMPWSRTNTKTSPDEPKSISGPADSDSPTTGAETGHASSGTPLQNMQGLQDAKKKILGGKGLTKVTTETGEEIPIKISIRDINPFAAVGKVLKQPAQFLAMTASGLLFGSQYSLTYTAALSFADSPYNYSSLNVGLILLAFGMGNIFGSVIGGRYSDIMLAKYKRMNGGKSAPEHRLRATLPAMPLIPIGFIAYAWTTDKTVPIYGPVIALFISGVGVVWVYSCVLAYIVDSAIGMASTAISCNSLFRGVTAFVASEVAEPLLSSVGNGPLYTGWAVLLVIAEAALVAACFRGQRWKEKSQDKLAQKEKEDREGSSAEDEDDGVQSVIIEVQR